MSEAPSGGSEKTHRRKRREKRKRLRELGYSEEYIADYIEKMHFQQDISRMGLEAARQKRYDSIPEPDDSKFKPGYRDPLLHGVARATGNTAKAVKAKKGLRRSDL